MRYDRQLLLLGAKRNAVLDLDEVLRYGVDSYGDADYVSIFGMRPSQWYAKGMRLLGRTAVECTRDDLASAIGTDVAAIAACAPAHRGITVIDPFVGSGNTLYWMLRHLPGARGFGFEADPTVYRITRRNLEILGLAIEIAPVDSIDDAALAIERDELVITFIAPPWGTALDAEHGLDLRRTEPPIAGIVERLLRRFAEQRHLCAIQVYEKLDAASLAEVTSCFDWSELRVYELNAPGQNHGVLLGSKRWVPAIAASSPRSGTPRSRRKRCESSGEASQGRRASRRSR